MASNATGNAEIQVSSLVAEQMRDPSITLLPDGGWIAVWTAESEDDVEFSHTLFQRFDAGGNPVGPETQVGDPEAFSLNATVLPLSDGGWLVIHDRGDIVQQRFDAAGNAVGGEIQVNTVSDDLRGLSATALEGGGWVVGWDRNGFNEQVFQQVFDADGNAVGGEVHVNTTTSGRHFLSDIEALPDGGWVVVWATGNSNVEQQRFDANGNPVGGETTVNTIAGGPNSTPTVTALVDGGWVVTWADPDADQSGIFQQRYDSDGVAVGSQTPVNTTTASFQTSPDVTALPDGGWVVVWHSGASQDGDGSGVYMQRFDANGDAVGTETLVNVTTAGSQDNASVTALDGGGWVVTWVSADPDTFDEVVMQRVFAADIEGTSGNDTLTGTVFGEAIFGLEGDDTIDGGDGDDTIEGGAGADNMDGGNGIDTLSYAGSAQGVTVRLSTGTASGGDAEGDTLQNFENLTGSAHNDTLEGTTGANVLKGGAGNDTLIGRGGADVLEGGDGNDTFDIQPTEDFTGATFDGGAGSDRLLLRTDGEGAHVYDLTEATLTSIEEIEFFADGGDLVEHTKTVTISATQLGNGALSSALLIDGNDSSNSKDFVVVTMGEATTLDLSAWTFVGWGTTSTFNGGANGDGEVITIIGDDDAETITGSSERDVIVGGKGDDTMLGGAGDDRFIWNNGDGSDTIDDEAGTDVLEVNLSDGEAGDLVTLRGDNNGATVERSNLGLFTIEALGVDRFEVNGNGGDDEIDIAGTRLSVTLDGGAGNDILRGAIINSTLRGGAGADQMFGGGGTANVLDYSTSAAGVEINLGTGLASGGDAEGDTFDNNFHVIVGSDHNDVLRGRLNNVKEQFFGGDGDDVLQGFDGEDQLFGGDGNDLLRDGGRGDKLDGGAGIDTMSVEGRSTGMTIDLAAGTGSNGTTIVDVENVIGTTKADTITGNDVANVLEGREGDDTINGGGGDDTIEGGAGADILDGGAGNNTLSYAGSSAGVLIHLGNGSASGGDAAGDTIANFQNLIGSSESDRFDGTIGANIIMGGDGSDVIFGRGGTDQLYGEAGNDEFAIDVVQEATGTLFDGGAGRNKLTIVSSSGVEDFRDDTIVSVHELFFDAGFDNDYELTFLAEQFAFDTVGANNSTRGSEDLTINIEMGSQTSLELSGVELVNMTSETDDFIISGDADAETITGSAIKDQISASGGNDTITGAGGNDVIDGGAGTDTAVYSGDWSDYLVTEAGGIITIVDQRDGSPDGTDTLTGVERLEFASGTSVIADALRAAPTSTAIAARTSKEGTAFAFDASAHFSDANTVFGDSLTYSATGLPSWLSIDAATGVLSGTPGFDDAAAAASVTVKATDVHGASTSRGFSLTVDNTNRAPVITSGGIGPNASVSVRENTTAVTTIVTIDPDAGATRVFSLSGTDAAKFSISSGGVLTFRSAPDFEAPSDVGGDNVYNVTVTVTDDGKLSDSQALAVSVTNANEAPTGVSLSKTSIAENKADTTVGTLAIADPDGPTASFKLASNPGGFFKIVGNALQTAKALDFEKAKSHAVTVEATDTGGVKTTKAFTINVTDVVDVITGTQKKDTLAGARGEDDIRGLGGKDKIFGKGRKDTLDGGDGNDTLVGGAGADKLKGGKGQDTASYEDAAKKVTANLKKAAKNKGDAAGDSYSSIEKLLGSANNDTLIGDHFDNVIRGGKGDDKITGHRGADMLTGNSGEDVFIFKGTGESTVGGKGRDTITDFTRKEDVIDLSLIDAKSKSKKSNQKFEFIGKDEFSGTAGELRFDGGSKRTFVYGDTDGDGKADFAIELTGKVNLKVGDFVL